MKILLAAPFRLFFTACPAYAVIMLIGWTGFLFTGWPLADGMDPFKWHSHEMLFGFGGAAIAGFLLTAVANWTQTKALSGAPLLALFTLWVLGRVGFWGSAYIPAPGRALLDLGFWLALLSYVTYLPFAQKNTRNLPVAGIIALLTLANAFMHWGFISGQTRVLTAGQQWGLGLLALLIAIIGGRIIPLFSRNWLQQRGANPNLVTQYALLDKTALITLLIWAVSLPLASGPLSGLLALIAALLHSARLLLWRGWRMRAQPLLWVLHLGYGWLVVSLWLQALSRWLLLPPTVWQHTLAVGGLGTMILAVMTRVAMGHTGRPLELVKGGLFIYGFITLAAFTRLLTAVGVLAFTPGIISSAVFWILAYGLFVILYVPVLCAPRADGRAG